MHKVTPLDSLSGIAIRYGSTIRAIKRANGGMISDATLFARGTLRVPRQALAEGAPLPGGGGVTGTLDTRGGAVSVTPALQKLRGYYSLAPGEENGGGAGAGGGGSVPPLSSTSGRAGESENVNEVQMVRIRSHV
jgi:hypothetical protein